MTSDARRGDRQADCRLACAERFDTGLPPCVQSPVNGGKCDLAPRDLTRPEKPHVQAFLAGTEHRRSGIGETGTEDHLHLADSGDAEYAEDTVDRDNRLRLLKRFAGSPFFQGFARGSK